MLELKANNSLPVLTNFILNREFINIYLFSKLAFIVQQYLPLSLFINI